MSVSGATSSSALRTSTASGTVAWSSRPFSVVAKLVFGEKLFEPHSLMPAAAASALATSATTMGGVAG